jgi:hypothetical protein
MTSGIRARLEELADLLHLHRGERPDIDDAHVTVSGALNTESTHGLGERLELHAIALEASHPKLGAGLRAIVEDLSAIGL